MPSIIEVLRRSEQGVTKPYICRADDGEMYFVKGRGAGRRSLICEWMAGHLAKAFGLPVADFELLEVSSDLVAASGPWLDDLGEGVVFGSRQHPATMEFGLPHLRLVEPALRRDVLVFDWWVRNADRSLSERGGNPNLCWDQAASRLLLIDHNQAFDRGFVAADFLQTHVFREEWRSIDLVEQANYLTRFESALAAWPAAINAIPEEWWFVDAERTVPADASAEALKDTVERFRAPNFWTV